jgi:L-rhamnose-H+ transport protein
MGNGWSGLVTTIVAGVITGSVLVPMKLMKKWPWENIWFLFSICAYGIAPWIVAFFSVPNLLNVYRLVAPSILVETFLLGVGWGFAVVLFGIAVDLVGLSISTALLYGSSVALGSLGALALLEPSQLGSAENLRILAWDILLVAGVLVCTQAGRLREPATSSEGVRTRRGVAISLLAGVLATLFNIVLIIGDPIRKQAIAAGADPNLGANAIWSLAVTGGALPSIAWSTRLLIRNHGWKIFRELHATRNTLQCVGMGVAWIAGTVLYGMATARMGKLGTAIAWPVYMSATILAGIGWGLGLGEWKGAPASSIRCLWIGVGTQIVAISFLSMAR